MKWRGIVTLGLFAIASSTASAQGGKPATYLLCAIGIGDKAWPIELTVDEPAQNVTIFFPKSGHSERRPAVFSPERVLFQSPGRFGGLSYTVSRVNLSLERTLTIGTNVSVDRGKCEVRKLPERAF